MSEASHGREFSFFVDGIKYTSEGATVTGAYIISLISGFDPSYSLYLEGHGDQPDQLINESSTISLENGEKHFYTVPPATFGDR